MSSSVILAGLGLAVVGFAGRYLSRAARVYGSTLSKKLEQFAQDNKYYKGGFNSTMTKEEARLILSVGSTADEKTIKLAHKRLSKLHHPDKIGGSQYLHQKINDAKSILTDQNSGLNRP